MPPPSRGRVNSRRKGADFELYVAAKLRAVWPAARRGLGQARGGAEAADVDGTPWWIQTKHGKRPNITAAMRQAVRDAAAAHDDRPPVAITRATNGPVLVTMMLSDWRALAAVFESQRPASTKAAA